VTSDKWQVISYGRKPSTSYELRRKFLAGIFKRLIFEKAVGFSS
jgi:hypothetical protein